MPSGLIGCEAAGAAGERLDLLADPARLLLAVPVADQADLLALGDVGPERLAEAALVGGDDAGGGGEDVRGRAVVLLEADHLGAGEVLLEAQDVADLGAAPAVDRLVVVADAADVVMRCRRAGAARGTGRRWCPDTRRRGCSGTSAGSARARRGGAAGSSTTCSSRSPKSQAFSVAQPLLVLGVELAAAVVEGARFRRGHPLGRERAVLPAVDQAGEEPRRPALLVDVGGLDDLAQQPDLVVGVEDGEVRLQPDELGVAAQDASPRASGRCRARACPR